MRILYIHQFFATRESTLGLIRSYEFSRRWVEQGHEVTVVTSSSRLPDAFQNELFAEDMIDGVRVRSVRVRYSNYMGYLRRMWSFLLFTFGAAWLASTSGKHDVVLATSTPLTVGIPGWMASKIRRTPFVFEVRDLWPEAAIQMGAIRRDSLLGRAAKRLERFLYRSADAVIALSPGMAAGVLAEGVDTARVHMVPNCSDTDLFSPGPKDAEMVERWDLAGKFVVGYAGAIGPSNDVDGQVPEAARLLSQRGRDDIVFVIAGDGKCLPRLEELTQGLANVKLLGSLPKAEIPRVTRTADVLMVLFADRPILATNSPNKFFDALAAGRPVIVNSPGWTRDLVTEHECGAYVPPGDGRALADAIERLADDASQRERMGGNARHLAEQRFARDLLSQQVLDVLQATAAAAR